MSNVIDADYSQQFLFPPCLEDFVPAGHPSRLVREFVDAIDLEELGFKSQDGETGRPSYAVGLQTKVILYGYMTKVRSTRGWERACHNDIGMLWLTGMNYPDHTTLWRCWDQNRAGLRKLFRQLLQIATAADLVGMVLHAVDGTKILSAASEQQAWRRTSLEEKLKKLDKAIDEILKETEQSSSDSGGVPQLPESLQKKQQLREMVQKQLAELKAKDRDHLNPKDPEARVMKTGARRMFAYNAQAVVDQKSQLIVAAEVVTDESDNYQLTPMLDEVKENMGKAADLTVADAGYMATTQLAEAEQKGYSVLVNLQEPAQDAKRQQYHASRFTYDAAKDHCICPRGETLEFSCERQRDKVQAYTVRIYRCQSYETCPVRWQCSSNKTGRTIQIHPNHASLVRQREKHRDEAMRVALKKRSVTVEPVFGWAKEVMGFRRWTVRSLEKVQVQWAVLCTAINLRRLHKFWSEGILRFT
jgi:transposase